MYMDLPCIRFVTQYVVPMASRVSAMERDILTYEWSELLQFSHVWVFDTVYLPKVRQHAIELLCELAENSPLFRCFVACYKVDKAFTARVSDWSRTDKCNGSLKAANSSATLRVYHKNNKSK